MARRIRAREVLRLRSVNGLSQNAIARTAHVSKHSVQDVLEAARERGVSWEDVEGMSEEAAYALFMEEKDALLPVGNLRALEEAMGDVVRVARVPATMLVSAHGEPMSVPRRCIGRPARIVCMPGGAMDCYVGGELVATHVAGGPAYDPAHYAEAMAGKRWFGDAAGDIEAAAAANLGLLDSIGGSL